MNIVDEIFRRADREATALIAGDRRLTFGQLQEMTESATDSLGLERGWRVGLNCANGVDHIVWSLAILKCGGVLVPVAPELSAVERDEQMRTTAIDVVLCAGGRKWHREAPGNRSLQSVGLQSAVLLHGLSPEPARFDEQALNLLNPALIRFSSGTMGVRKGVVLSHQTLLGRVTASNTHLGLGPGDRVIWILPMAHHFAVSIILYLLHGVTTVLEDSHLGEDVFNALHRHEGTALYASPFHYALLASCESARAVPSLRIAVSTAAALPADTATRFRERFGVPLRQALGIIECGLPLLNDLWPAEKPASVGRSQEGYKTSIRDAQGQAVPEGEVGELLIRGPGLVDAYLSPWMTRESILQDGWFRTGDLASRDADGAFFLVGRTQAVINVGGMKCFPEEVEAALCSHPAVAECRVSALGHPTFGSVPVAEVVLATGVAEAPKPSELMGWCRARLSSYKLPVKISFVPAIPKTASGKIQR
jgi:long-chain acyl-CoA synthetase